MSAFIVSNKTINLIVGGLIVHPELKVWVKRWYVDDEPAHFGKHLRKLNELSVAGRYDKKRISEFTGGIDYEYKRQCPLDAYHLLKLIRCFLYQSCESGADHKQLYKAIDRMASEVAMIIVMDSVGYHRSTGWDD